MKVGVGYCDFPDSTVAGRIATQKALENAERPDACDFVLLFSTSRHNQEALRKEVAATIGNSTLIYGGGATGIITNQDFGYAGDQVGVACVWLDDSDCKMLIEGGLLENEHDVGVRLGKQLAAHGVSHDSPILLFYDAVDRTQGSLRLLMATWILEGIKSGLGFLPDIMGAGMMADHLCTPSAQYIGEKIGHSQALACILSDDIIVDNVILHGCRPASPYYTVTKSDGPVILEINEKPAITFMDELLGPAIRPEDYPFFLIFGINHGERWGDYDENNYASRLCLNIDKERNGIVMFEPDMVAGTEFQVMFRSLELGYMAPKINEFITTIKTDREPFFALYIDCAGRCAGYGGMELEDAYIIQEAANKLHIPLLGLYTGVEIARIGGVSRGLDWTGVFCVFSKGKDGKKVQPLAKKSALWQDTTIRSVENEDFPSTKITSLCEQNMAKVLSLDTQTIAIRHELEQKRRGFSLLAELSVSLKQVTNDDSILSTVAKRINTTLNMQKTVVLTPDASGQFYPSILKGFSPEELAKLSGQLITIDTELMDITKSVLITASDDNEYLANIRNILGLPYFISTPIIVENALTAILITGRMIEAPPFLSRLGNNDMETVQAICALLSSVLVYKRLDDVNKQALTDVLTGLENRRALEQKVPELLKQELQHHTVTAFIMIDIDYFKQINDTYGHEIGDKTLVLLAQTLRNSFRATDTIARLGGDEFAIFCTLTGDIDNINLRMAQLFTDWSSTTITINKNQSFSSTLSGGIAFAPKDGVTYNELLHKADVALYKAKQLGRNNFKIYNDETMSGSIK